MSNVGKNGDWETRKISVIGTLQSFISQLSIGDEITKVSLPAVLLAPYSATELAAFRTLGYVHLLLRANRETDPFRRFLCVLRWYLSYTQKEKFKRKPYNPILGETHACWIDTPNLDDTSDAKRTQSTGITKFFAEQTSHHPPITGFILENSAENVFVEANVSFSTKYYGNSAGVASSGKELVHLRNFDEVYCFSKCMPDIMIRNMILGTKRIAWEGETILSCEKTGLKAVFHYKEEGWHCINVVKGYIVNLSEPDKKLYTFDGPCGEDINLVDPTTKKKIEVLMESSKLTRISLHYLPRDKWSEHNSLRVWDQLSRAIERDDMYQADVAKRAVEDEQRKRKNEGKSLEPQYFKFSDDFWHFVKDKQSEVDDIILQGLITTDQPPASPQLEKKRPSSKDEEEDEDNVEGIDG